MGIVKTVTVAVSKKVMKEFLKFDRFKKSIFASVKNEKHAFQFDSYQKNVRSYVSDKIGKQ